MLGHKDEGRDAEFLFLPDLLENLLGDVCCGFRLEEGSPAITNEGMK